ncbi:MAG: hypothetical protein MI919_08210 [Holophagales bacterium]|nr:hypothetical protein [Holophagales bacterium]
MAFVLALIWLIAGIAPALHHHEAKVAVDAHCHHSELTASTHLETREPAYHESCGLCAKSQPFSSLERPLSTSAGQAITEREREGYRILPPGPPGRHGASRAPPLA